MAPLSLHVVSIHVRVRRSVGISYDKMGLVDAAIADFSRVLELDAMNSGDDDQSSFANQSAHTPPLPPPTSQSSLPSVSVSVLLPSEQQIHVVSAGVGSQVLSAAAPAASPLFRANVPSVGGLNQSVSFVRGDRPGYYPSASTVDSGSVRGSGTRTTTTKTTSTPLTTHFTNSSAGGGSDSKVIPASTFLAKISSLGTKPNY
jgi:hypothetical protein